jgi:histidyl-tRNA synthetase
MKTLISHYKEIKEKLKSQLERVETTDQAVKIVQDEINKLADLSGDYIRGLTPPQARLATVMLKALNQYTSILILVKLQDSTPNTSEKSHSNANSQSENQLGLTELTSNTLAPFNTITQIEKNLKALTSLDYYKQALSQQVQQNREVMSSLLAGGITGTLAGGYSWGLIGAITGGVIGKIVQQTQSSENTGVTSQPEPPKNKLKIGVDIDKLLDHLYQAFQSIDLTVAAYGGTQEKAPKPGLENHLDLLEYLQDLMAEGLDEQTQLPTAVRRRIEQAATILRRYGIETRVYQPTEEQELAMEAWSMFYFEPSLDPQTTDYITLKHAFVKDDQVLLPGSVVEPASSSAA